MTGRTSFRAMISAHVGPFLHARGYAGTASVWRRANQYGDSVGVQFYRKESEFFTEIGMVPGALWQYFRHDGTVKPDAEPDVLVGLLRSRIRRDPAGLPPRQAMFAQSWPLHDDPDAMRAIAEELCRQLDTVGLPTVEPFLDRDRLLEHLRQRASTGQVKPILAFVLSDHGPSAELDSVLADLPISCEPDDVDLRTSQVTWVRNRLRRPQEVAPDSRPRSAFWRR
jgi:hypothetical protein